MVRRIFHEAFVGFGFIMTMLHASTAVDQDCGASGFCPSRGPAGNESVDISAATALKSSWHSVHNDLVGALDSAANIAVLIPLDHPEGNPARLFLAQCTSQLRSSMDWWGKFRGFYSTHKPYQAFLVSHWLKVNTPKALTIDVPPADRKFDAKNAIHQIKNLLEPVNDFMEKAKKGMPEISTNEAKQKEQYAALYAFVYEPLDTNTKSNNFTKLLDAQEDALLELSKHQRKKMNPLRSQIAKLDMSIKVTEDYVNRATSDEDYETARSRDLKDWADKKQKEYDDNGVDEYYFIFKAWSWSEENPSARHARDSSLLARRAAEADLDKARNGKVDLNKELTRYTEEIRGLKGDLKTAAVKETKLLKEYQAATEKVQEIRKAMLAENKRFPGRSVAEINKLAEGIARFQTSSGLSTRHSLKQFILNYLETRHGILTSLLQLWQSELTGGDVTYVHFLRSVSEECLKALRLEDITMDTVKEQLQLYRGANNKDMDWVKNLLS